MAVRIGSRHLGGSRPRRFAAALASCLLLAAPDAVQAQWHGGYGGGGNGGGGYGGGGIGLVAFAPAATAAAIEGLLRETGASIVDGPRAGGLFRLRLADRTADPKAVEALIDRLRANGEVVRLVAPEPPQQGR